jgi:hypothetical protein
MWNRRVKQLYERFSYSYGNAPEYIQNQMIPYHEYLKLQSNEIGIQEYIAKFQNNQLTENRDIELSFFENAI